MPLVEVIKVPDNLFPPTVEINAAPELLAVKVQFMAVTVPAVEFTAG
jgi:hypothetical protein